jgi:predicted nucleotidyltransferase
MPKNINKEIQEFIQEVQQLLGKRLKKIILYGSYARGDYNKKSDVDIMILTDLSFKEIEDYRDKVSDIAYDIELETGIILSPVIKNIEKYNSRVNFVPFYKNVQKEGVVLVNG